MSNPFEIPKEERRGRFTQRRDDNPTANYIRRARVDNGWTQTQLAERAGIGLATLRAIEQGKQSINLGSVNKVLAVFGQILVPQNKQAALSQEPNHEES